MWGMKRVLILLILCLGSSFLWAQKEEYFITLWELPKGELFFRDFTNKNNAIPIGTTLVNSKTNECYYPKVWVYGSETLSRFDIPENGMYTLYILSQEIEIKWWTSFVKSHFRGVVQWGNYVWNNARELKDLFITPVFANAGAPKLGMKSLSYFFQGFDMSQINVEDWDVSNVKDFSHMFEGCKSFDQDLGRWNVSNAVRMDSMFANCKEFHGENLGNWDVSKVCDVTGMFAGCSVFNAPLNNWNVGAVKTFRDMFRGCESFDQDLGKWDVRSATNMSGMFAGCRSFNQNLSNWNVRNVVYMSEMFAGCSSFNQPLNDWADKVRNVKYFAKFLKDAVLFNQPLNDWDVSHAIYMGEMFAFAKSFNQPLDKWIVTNADMPKMFFRATSFNQNLGKWILSTGSTLGLSSCGMDVENYSKTLIGWENTRLSGEGKKCFIEAAGLFYNNSAAKARESLSARQYRWFVFEGDQLLEHYILLKKAEVDIREGQQTNLRISTAGVTEDELEELEWEVEDDSIVELVDKGELKIKGVDAGTTKLTVRIPSNDVHDDLETTCTVTVKPSNKKTTTTPAATPAKKKQNAASRVRK